MTPSVQATEADNTIDVRQAGKEKQIQERMGEEDPAWRSIRKRQFKLWV